VVPSVPPRSGDALNLYAVRIITCFIIFKVTMERKSTGNVDDGSSRSSPLLTFKKGLLIDDLRLTLPRLDGHA
jgi:hypothetical protein